MKNLLKITLIVALASSLDILPIWILLTFLFISAGAIVHIIRSLT